MCVYYYYQQVLSTILERCSLIESYDWDLRYAFFPVFSFKSISCAFLLLLLRHVRHDPSSMKFFLQVSSGLVGSNRAPYLSYFRHPFVRHVEHTATFFKFSLFLGCFSIYLLIVFNEWFFFLPLLLYPSIDLSMPLQAGQF